MDPTAKSGSPEVVREVCRKRHCQAGPGCGSGCRDVVFTPVLSASNGMGGDHRRVSGSLAGYGDAGVPEAQWQVWMTRESRLAAAAPQISAIWGQWGTG